MAKKCYKINTIGCDNNPYQFFRCSESITSGPPASCGNVRIIQAEGFSPGDGSCKSLSITIVSCSFCPGCCPDPIDPNKPFDCVNGGCVPKATYNTPGVFATLAACQSGCAKNSNCTGECVDPSEIAGLRQAINNLQAKIC